MVKSVDGLYTFLGQSLICTLLQGRRLTALHADILTHLNFKVFFHS